MKNKIQHGRGLFLSTRLCRPDEVTHDPLWIRNQLRKVHKQFFQVNRKRTFATLLSAVEPNKWRRRTESHFKIVRVLELSVKWLLLNRTRKSYFYKRRPQCVGRNAQTSLGSQTIWWILGCPVDILWYLTGCPQEIPPVQNKW